MKCRYPYLLTKGSASGTIVPCGRCMACRVNRTTEWTTRILHEARLHNDSIFLTLTYDDSSLPFGNSLQKSDLQLFFKRLRKALPHKKIRYYACGEYGEKFSRPHYHAIVFGLSKKDEEVIEYAWCEYYGVICGFKIYRQLGKIDVGTCTEQSARYVAGYIQKQLFRKSGEGNIIPEFTLSSRRPGIGFDFQTKFIDVWLRHGYVVVNGKKRPIPRFYRDRAKEEYQKAYKLKRKWNNIWKSNTKRICEGKTHEEVWQQEYDAKEGLEKDLIARHKIYGGGTM